jgi:DNA-binding CsgD family transcriptional regulator
MSPEPRDERPPDERASLDERAPLDEGAPRRNPWPSLIMATVAALAAVDIVDDAHVGVEWQHIFIEVALFVAAATGAVVLWWQLVRARTANVALHAHLDQARADLERFRAESQDVMRGLGEVIDRQFERWQLSPAEREVALLLLKGLSHKDVAEVRRTSERTVRQQSLAVYRKGGLAGRAELAAFFLEDLLLPAQAADSAAGSPARLA